MKGRIATFQRNVKWIGDIKFLCVWFQGCLRNCKGCESQQFRKFLPWIKAEPFIQQILRSIREDRCPNLMVSGGEPFLQPKLLLRILRRARKVIKQMGLRPNIIVYTGYRIEQIAQLPKGKKILALISVLVDGEYIESLNDGKALRGSSNQRIIFLDLAMEKLYAPYLAGGRNFEVVWNEPLGEFIGVGLTPKYTIDKEKGEKNETK